MNLKAYQVQFLQALQEKDQADWTFKNCTLTETFERFSIYRDSIAGHHLKALKNIFPSTIRLVGSEYFDHVAGLYLMSYQNTENILDNVGKDFSAFLKGQMTVTAQLPYLADFVTLEWHWYQVLQGVNNPALPLQSFDSLMEQRAEFSLPRNARLVTSVYPIFQLWTFSQPEYKGDFTLKMESLPEHLLLFQRAQAVHLKKIESETEWVFLLSLKEPRKISFQESPFENLQSLWLRGCLQTASIKL